MDDVDEPLADRKRKHADGNEILRWSVVAEYNLHRKDLHSNLPGGVRDQICNKFGISHATMSRYVEAWDSQRNEVVVPDLSPDRTGKCGIHNLMLTEEIVDCIFELSSELKGDFSYESFTQKFNDEYEVEPRVSVATMWRWFQKLQVVETMSYIKPQLETRHLIRRLNFILQKLEPVEGIQKIIDQRFHIHVDEKWFFAVRERKKIKLLPGQAFKSETTRHKNHIMKVMFLAAVGMPQYLPNGIDFFDGKIGIFPVIKMTVAKRKSKNRDAGAAVMENVSMTAAEYLSVMTKPDGILAAIREKMHWARGDKIVIQHDGAPAHVEKGNLVALPEAGQQDGWNICFDTQPAQSPDLNLCDLCFFNSLQKRSFQIRSKSTTEMQLVDTVRQAWAEYDWETIQRSWGHLFSVYRSVLDAGGSNQYERPHSDVRARQKSGAGAIDPYVSMDTYLNGMEARDALDNAP